ncbi:hypothetical protein DY000_02008737 [Brassica cretica]|uniref:Uncharacterized protein n=1 Tax=Brassica cretica TaxID=69181 RepID=A0ABQ7BYC4_BRACR|nr:hypothetical protein DY000_02008737 [Brassica cretica]
MSFSPIKLALKMKLPEEQAEEEDMRLCGFGPCLHHHHDHESSSHLSGFVMFVQGKPAKWFVDALALLGIDVLCCYLESFLINPVYLVVVTTHDHDHHGHHDHHHSDLPSHSHSIQDLSVGLSVLGKERKTSASDVVDKSDSVADMYYFRWEIGQTCTWGRRTQA